MNASALYLKVQQIDKVCLFELSWGKGQQINATLTYPENLTKLYQEWQRTYLNFYQTSLRGRVADAGILAAPPIDWHAKLVQAEAQLLYEFHNWLRSAELYEIRSVIANKNRELATNTPPVEVFLSCNPLDLARLPWEAWEINTEFAADKIHIVRAPLNIREKVTTSNNRCNRKARVLAILGDDTGLNFNSEKSAISSLEKIAEVKFIGWQPGKDIPELKTEIVEAIASKTGWDILFFAGHSNETSLTGGELSIAPNVALSLSEIVPCLTVAKERGLQFAIFNSCSGLSIANKLIDLGLSQVAVMREPIHNRVAEEFFVLFLQALTEYKDVHESLLAACEYLKLEKNLTYPSSYLTPSLFRHPEAPLFRLEPFGLKQQLKNLIPTRREAIALSSLILISLQLPVQQFLLERRLLAQAMYRQVTHQVEVLTPPVLLVQIDEKSIRDAGISNPKPMERKYLARLVDKLTVAKARVVGIDYFLDRHQGKSDNILAQSLQAAVKSPNPTTFVFATTRVKSGEWLKVLPHIASPNWSLQGEIDVLPGYMQLFPIVKSNSEPLFFAGLLAISQQLQQLPNSPKPQLNSQKDFWQQISANLEAGNKDNKTILTSERSRLQPLTALSYWIGQMWLHPIIDFSIPPDQIYHPIPAWKLLEGEETFRRKVCTGVGKKCAFPNLQKQIVIVAPGGYGEAGVSKDDEDNFELPAAVAYWRSQENPVNQSQVFTGGEYHAYMVHHLLNQRLVVPIPDLWMIVIAILLGKTMYLLRQTKKHHAPGIILVAIITLLYGLISLQIYISSTAVLLPWFLPSATLWIYVLPSVLRRKVNE
ncbi:CHASE2 domain-containing protein [Iningainema tapete]|uniref:CHASE2 domain-containing protein n=1 Tax=Iningainema tapete BLCC-T55 TaxID=2748662 RepID=A0A8J6XH07_9CYAN|nr:CHASE2 domain-containing protein [Iningainema tapete]MBD2771956.1 CHASE2 domain-containing protein [Iningainema tapete BLCC-T55]